MINFKKNIKDLMDKGDGKSRWSGIEKIPLGSRIRLRSYGATKREVISPKQGMNKKISNIQHSISKGQ